VTPLDLSQNTALLLASLLLLAVAFDGWARIRRPLWLSIAWRVGAFTALTLLVMRALGSPLRPRFETDHSGMLLWQQMVEIGWWISGARALAEGMRALVALEDRPHESRIVSDLMAGGIYIATALAITNFAFAVPIGGLLATSGVIAIVLGLALQSTLADVFSGIAVGLERPYVPGDVLWVEGDIEGVVTQVSWRSTQIQTRQNNIAIVPNSVIAKSRLVNRNSPTPTRVDTMAIKLDAHADPQRCVTTLRAAVQTCLLPIASPAPYVAYTGLVGDGSTYEIVYSVGSTADLVAARTELLSQVHRHLLYAAIALAVAGVASPPPVPPTTIADLLARSDVFSALPAEERALLAPHFAATPLDQGTKLIGQDEVPTALFLIASGTVEVTREDGGVRRVMARLGPGESLGLVGLFTGQPHPATGIALCNVEAYTLDKASVAAALKVCPNMAVGLEALARRRAQVLAQVNASVHEGDEPEHSEAFLVRIRQVLHRLAA
jgi:small-conductance mechanosensitive channel/CRP-like cAMP-binding protein